ncbi:hypothetical protein BVY04_02130 [bacterium M21]|nr:hypothetical protein BVY04_02130 [bacterium M21]
MVRYQLGIICIGLALFTSGCAFHSTAKNWNGLVGRDGKPAYYKKTTKVVFNAFVLVPFLGNANIDGMVRDMTADIVKKKGNNVRIVQGSSENYWYGFPPFTWVVTPVVTTVSSEYTPDRKTYFSDQKKIRADAKESTNLNPLEW